MMQLALLHPTNLLGQEVRESLDRRREWWTSLTLLTTQEDEVGNLTEVRGGAAMVSAFEPAALAGVDVVFLCGPLAHNRPVLEALPPGATAILLSPDAGVDAGRPLVQGANLREAFRGELLLSPHPVVVALCQLLAPLLPLGLEGVSATVVLPASSHEQAGLDELFEQTRAILAFAENKPEEVFGRQMAFNLAPPLGNAPLPDLGALTHGVLPEAPPVSVQLLQGGIFHSLSLSVHLRFQGNPSSDDLRAAFEDHDLIALEEEDPAPGPIDAAAREEVLLGRIARDPQHPGQYWLWAVADNLTRAGALNALAILEKVLESPPAN